jgi:hypothetical protein
MEFKIFMSDLSLTFSSSGGTKKIHAWVESSCGGTKDYSGTWSQTSGDTTYLTNSTNTDGSLTITATSSSTAKSAEYKWTSSKKSSCNYTCTVNLPAKSVGYTHELCCTFYVHPSYTSSITVTMSLISTISNPNGGVPSTVTSTVSTTDYLDACDTITSLQAMKLCNISASSGDSNNYYCYTSQLSGNVSYDSNNNYSVSTMYMFISTILLI